MKRNRSRQHKKVANVLLEEIVLLSETVTIYPNEIVGLLTKHNNYSFLHTYKNEKIGLKSCLRM